MYTRLWNYTNMVVDEHGIQTFKVVVVMLLLLLLLFDVFAPTNAHPLLFLEKWFIQIYLNVSLLGLHSLEALAFGTKSDYINGVTYMLNLNGPNLVWGPHLHGLHCCQSIVSFSNMLTLNTLLLWVAEYSKPHMPDQNLLVCLIFEHLWLCEKEIKN